MSKECVPCTQCMGDSKCGREHMVTGKFHCQDAKPIEQQPTPTVEVLENNSRIRQLLYVPKSRP